MVRQGIQLLVCAAACCWLAESLAKDNEADEDEAPDMAFLEYLGMWEETDEDWLLLENETVVENEARPDPVSDDEAATERNDES